MLERYGVTLDHLTDSANGRKPKLSVEAEGDQPQAVKRGELRFPTMAKALRAAAAGIRPVAGEDRGGRLGRGRRQDRSGVERGIAYGTVLAAVQKRPREVGESGALRTGD